MLLNDFIDVSSVQFKPKRNEEQEGIGSGQIIRAELTTQLWEARIRTPLTTFEDGRRIRALFNKLSKPNAWFYVYDPIGKYPQNDPNGTILGASIVTVNSVTSGKISFAGLPANYELSMGDYFQIDKAGRRYFFEISEDVVADGTGVTPEFETSPNVSNTIALADPVTLTLPQMKCQFIPDELDYATVESSSWKMGGFSFAAVQKL